MKNRWVTAIASAATVVAIAATIVVLGMSSAKGERAPEWRTPGPEDTHPPLPADAIPIPALYTPPPGAPVTIRGEDVVLPEGMIHTLQAGPNSGGLLNVLEYGKDSERSWLVIRMDGELVQGEIREEHREVFEEIINIVGEPPPSPTPILATIGDRTLTLPDGFIYTEISWNATRDNFNSKAWFIGYKDDSGISRLYFDDDGKVLEDTVLPAHRLFYADVYQLVQE